MYSMNLNGINGLNRNSKNYSDNTMTTSNLISNHNLNHLANCVPNNQMLVNNNMINNNFFNNTTNDSNYNDLQSLDSDTQDSLLKFWKCDSDTDKNFI